MSNGIMANSVLNAAAGLTMLVTGFLCSIIAARLLGPEANGIIAFAFWLSTTATLIAGLGTDVILPRMLPQLKAQGYDAEARRGFGAHLSRAVITVVFFLLCIYTASYYETERLHWASTAPTVLVITGALFLVQSIGMLSINFMIGEQQLSTFFKLTVLSAVLQLSVVLAGAIFYGAAGALAGYVVGQGVFFVYAIRLFAVRPNACGTHAGTLARTSMIISMQIVVDSIFLNRIELLFLQQFQGVTAVGFYAIGLSLANLALQLPVQLTGSLVPYYTEQLQSQPTGKLPIHLFENVIRSLAYFTLPMGLGLAAISWELVSEIYGEAFTPAGNVVALLALSAPLSVFVQVSTKYLFAIDREGDRLKIGMAGALIMVVGCLALVPTLGGEGAAVARMAVLAVMSVLMVKRMDFDGSMRGMFMSLTKISAASLICAVAAFVVADAINGPVGVLAAIVAAAIAYMLALRALRAVPAGDIAIMEPMLDRLPGRLKAPGKHMLALVANARPA